MSEAFSMDENTQQQGDQTEGQANPGINYEDADGFSFNLAEEKATSGFPLLPKGNHLAEVESCEFKISKNSGNPMWELKWVFLEGELAEKNRKAFSYMMWNEEQRGRSKGILLRIAPDVAAMTEFNPKKVAESGVMIGRKGTLKVTHKKNDAGEDTSNISDVLAPKSGGNAGQFSL